MEKEPTPNSDYHPNRGKSAKKYRMGSPSTRVGIPALIKQVEALRDENRSVCVEELQKIFKIGVLNIQVLRNYARKYWVKGEDYEFTDPFKKYIVMSPQMTYDFLSAVIENLRKKNVNWEKPKYLRKLADKSDLLEKVKERLNDKGEE